MSDDVVKPIVSIVVPVHNQCEKTVKCFAAIRANIKIPYELIWVDNASNEDEYNIIRKQATRPRVHCKLVRNAANVGFVKAVNQGIAEAKAPYILLLNNDTEVGWKLAEKLIVPLATDPTVGATGPVTNSEVGWQGIVNINRRWDIHLPKFTEGKIPEYSRELEKIAGSKCIDVGKLPLSFFCCMLRRSTFKHLGVLDPLFGIGLGDDDDYSMRLRAHGFRQVLVLGAFCLHHHRTTFNALHLNVDSLRRHSVKVLKKNALIYDAVEKDLLAKKP